LAGLLEITGCKVASRQTRQRLQVLGLHLQRLGVGLRGGVKIVGLKR
jgi:hypothetical protein